MHGNFILHAQDNSRATLDPDYAVLCGDLDYEVDFELIGHTVPDSGVRVTGLLLLNVDGTSLAGVERYTRGQPG